MLAPDAPKDNANPTIHAIEEDLLAEKEKPLAWSQLQALHALPEEDGDDQRTNYFQSPADRAVVHALLDTLQASQGEGVALLRKAGVALPGYIESNSSATTASSSGPTLPRFVPYSARKTQQQLEEDLEGKRDDITPNEIFAIIRNIQDPEHAGVTLEQLRVVSRGQIEVQMGTLPNEDAINDGPESFQLPTVSVRFTPTIPHCSQATLIGLSLRVKLERSLPKRFKIKVFIEPGTHNTEDEVNKQLADKERVAAALENAHLLNIVNKCIREGMALQQ